MSTTLFKIAAVTAVSFAAMATSAQAQSRYGDINAYEGAADCLPTACEPVVNAPSSRYGSTTTVAPAYNQAPVYVDCSVTGTCAPAVMAQPTTVYTQPYAQQAAPTIQMYEQPAVSMSVNCPAGTTAQNDGTCMQTGSSMSMGSSYSRDSWSSASTTVAADCPMGTSPQPDGTCMQTGASIGASTSYSMGSTYTPSTTTMMPANCPAGTTAQADGTCAQGSSYSTATVYEGDATPSYGYANDGSYGTQTTYLPIRK